MRALGIRKLIGLAECCLDMLYPRSAGCPMCAHSICSCKERLIQEYFSAERCPRCGKFFRQCGNCIDCYNRGEGFPDKVAALGPFAAELRKALHKFKYGGDKRIGAYFAELLLRGPVRDLEVPEIIIPVPLHPQRGRQRGFNQAGIIAAAIASYHSIDYAPYALKRVAVTKPQSLLKRENRRSNLVSAFELACPELVRGKRVLLVDDIITTGYTLEECGRELRSGGVVKLEAVCVAAGLA